jgi:hypothetical protein
MYVFDFSAIESLEHCVNLGLIDGLAGSLEDGDD